MFDFGNYLPYLLNRAGARIATSFSRDVRHLDIALQEWRVLASLHFTGAQRMSDLSGHISIDRTTLSRLIGRMEDLNLVRRARKTEDGREVHIELTAGGAAMAQQIVPVAERYEAAALDGFSEEEAKQLKSMLKRIYANFDRM